MRALEQAPSGGEVAVALLVTALALLPMLAIGFVNDDVAIVSYCFRGGHPDLATLLTRRALTDYYYRPLVDLSYGVDFLIWGWNPFGFRLTNLILHLANVLLVFQVAATLLRSRSQALLAAALFGVLPIHETSLFWIPGRSDVLCTTFVLGSIGFLLSYLESSRASALALSLAAFVLALLSKEMAFSLPLLAFAVAWWHGRSPGRALRTSLPYVAVAAAMIAVRWWAFGNNLLGDQGWHGNVAPTHLLKNLASYLGLLIVPLGHYQIERLLSGQPLLFMVLALAALGVATLALWKARAERRALVLSALWVGITLLPVIRLMYRWYLYLPSVGFAIALGSLLARARERGQAAMVFGLALWGLYAGITVAEARPWIEASRHYAKWLREIGSQATWSKGADTLTFVTTPGKIGTTPVFQLGLPAALRQALGRDDLDAVTWAPLTLDRLPARVDYQVGAGARSIRLAVHGGSFTIFDAALISQRRAPEPGVAARVGEARISIERVDQHRKPSALEIELDRPLPRNTFLFDGARFVRLR